MRRKGREENILRCPGVNGAQCARGSGPRSHVVKGARHSQDSSAASFFSSPVIRTAFLDSWLAILPDATIQPAVVDQLGRILDRERQGSPFDLSIKTTLLLAQK